jgi:hypothetical protein
VQFEGGFAMRLSILLVAFLATLIAGQLLRGEENAPVVPRIPQYLDLLKRPIIRQELQVIPMQAEEIEKLAANRSAILAAGLTELRFGGLKEDRVAAHKKMQTNLLAVENKAYELLLPFQQKRLDQIVNQVAVRAGEPTAGLIHKDMVAALGLTEKELQAIRVKGAEVDARLKEKLEKLRLEMKAARDSARREVLSLLSEDQRRLYAEINGEYIDINEPVPPPPPKPAETAADSPPK